jgi:hypothetical protein
MRISPEVDEQVLGTDNFQAWFIEDSSGMSLRNGQSNSISKAYTVRNQWVEEGDLVRVGRW